jgi:hypothetical protein
VNRNNFFNRLFSSSVRQRTDEGRDTDELALQEIHAARVLENPGSRNTSMKRTTNSFWIGVISLILSAGALAADGTKANGSVDQSPTTQAAAATAMAIPPEAKSTGPLAAPIAQSTPTAAPTTIHTTGQPNASCEETPNTPGNSASATGSAFNPEGKAGTVYAGERPQNSRNPASVSQYDVACARQH